MTGTRTILIALLAGVTGIGVGVAGSELVEDDNPPATKPTTPVAQDRAALVRLLEEVDLQYLDAEDVGVSLTSFCDTYRAQQPDAICFVAGDRVYFAN